MKTIMACTLSLLAGVAAATAQITYSTFGDTYSENFDGMGPTGTTTPAGWFHGAGNSANNTSGLTVSDGGETSGVEYNFGLTGDGNRALGVMTAGNARLFEVRITNNTGLPIPAFELFYDGEQWRRQIGGTQPVSPDILSAYYAISMNAGDLHQNNFTAMGSQFNFATIHHEGSNTALNGNDPANRIADIGGLFTLGTPLLHGQTLYLRFRMESSTTRHGLAVDNFRFTAVPEPSAMLLLGAGLAFLALRRRAC